jgi:hypothetical protein
MLKRIWLAIMFLFILSSSVFAGVETVKDNNDGNKGYILINTGTKNGQSDVGHWTDIVTIPELKGEKGDIGQSGKDGLNGEQGLSGVNGQDGKNGTDGKDGKKGEQGEIGKGLKDQYKAGIELRILDTKHTTWSTYMNRDFNNKTNEIGVKVTIKLGKSYELRRIEELEKKLK